MALAEIAGITSFALAESGQISPESIEVDGDMYPSAVLNVNVGTVDEVADQNADNSGTDCLADDGVVMCNEANVTARAQGKGSWNGLRILDGLSDSDDTFLGGSKFSDTSTWVVGLGNVGSSKNDASEVYLANNDHMLYFGMLRVGNNGTTAFDFEFSRLAPDPQNPYVPNRSVDDLLLVFELSGSGKSGSVAISGYKWDGSKWVAFALPAATQRAINDVDVAAPPWGARDSKGVWGSANLRRFTFAEVGIPIGPGGIQPPVDPNDCSQSAWVGTRTRASTEFTSDMKDAFEIVNYEFSGLKVAAMKTAESAKDLTITVSGVVDGGSVSHQWQVFNDQTQLWQAIPGATGADMVLGYDDAIWTWPLATTTVVDTPFVAGGDQYVGQAITTRVRLAASQSIAGQSCTVDSNTVTIKQLRAVDP